MAVWNIFFLLAPIPISIGFPFETLHPINVSSTYIYIYIYIPLHIHLCSYVYIYLYTYIYTYIVSVFIHRPYSSVCGSNTNLEWYQLEFWNKPILITPSDINTLKYNNLTNLTGMIWQIDPAPKILGTWFETCSPQACNGLKSRNRSIQICNDLRI